MRILYSLLLCCLVHTVQAQCNATITPLGPTSFCLPGSVTFVASPGDVYKWFKDGNYIALLVTDTFTVNSSGSYTVVVDSAGCIDTSASITVMAGTPPQPGPITGPTELCAGSTYTFSVAAVPGATSYSWGGSNSSWSSFYAITTSPTRTGPVGPSGSFTSPSAAVMVAAINSCGQSAPSILSVNSYSGKDLNGMNNDHDITYGGIEPYICPTGTNNKLNAFHHGYGSGYSPTPAYQWFRNNVAVPGATGYEYYIQKGGSYKVQLTTGGVCVQTIQKPLVHQIAPLPVSIDVTPTSICSGGVAVLNVNFDMDGYDGTAYNWWLICNGGPYSGGFITTVSGDYSVGLWGLVFNNIMQCPSSPVLANVPASGSQATPVSIVQNGNDFTATQGFVSYQWYRYYMPIAGATGSTFTKTTWGDYSVVAVDANGCASRSNVILGVEEMPRDGRGIQLYPNPNTGTFSLSANLAESTTANLTITDLAGRTIQTKQIRTTSGLIEEEIELDNSIAPGLYLLKLTTENYNKVVSFVKQ